MTHHHDSLCNTWNISHQGLVRPSTTVFSWLKPPPGFRHGPTNGTGPVKTRKQTWVLKDDTPPWFNMQYMKHISQGTSETNGGSWCDTISSQHRKRRDNTCVVAGTGMGYLPLGFDSYALWWPAGTFSTWPYVECSLGDTPSDTTSRLTNCMVSCWYWFHGCGLM